MTTELNSFDPDQAPEGTYTILTNSGSRYIVTLHANGLRKVQRLPAVTADPQWVDELTPMTRGLPKFVVGKTATLWKYGAGTDDDLWVRCATVLGITYGEAGG